MSSSTQQTIATGATSLTHATRPARALIGWMKEGEAQLMLAERVTDNAQSKLHAERASAARQAVAARTPFADDQQTLEEPGGELKSHVAALTSHNDFKPFESEGWSVKIADLGRVIALQPMVFWDHAQERTSSASADKMSDLANITIPIRSATETLPLQFDPARNTWLISSRNPNLKIAGQFNGPVDIGAGQKLTACGFLVTVMPSFVQVVRYRGRLLLRDGYHRSLGLIARGITRVPVLFREFGEFEPLGLGVGMLADAAYLGQRPPLLADYLSEAVAAEVNLPATQKMIVVQGMEMNPIG